MHLTFYYIHRITGQLLPVYPIYVLLFQAKGLSLSAISMLLIIWCLPGMLLEVPSSILADRWSRRNLLVIGSILKGICFVVWGMSNSFFGFAAGFILWGTGGAFSSGTEEAWLYDYLRSCSRESEFDRILGKSTFYSQLAIGIAGIIGSLLATVSMTLTLWLSVGCMAVSTLFAAALKEYRHQTMKSQGDQWRNYLHTLKDGVSFCISHKFIPVMIGFSVTVLVTAGVLDEYDQLIVRSMGVPLGFVGLWAFLRYGTEALGGRVAWRFKNLFNKTGITKPFTMQLCLAAISGLMLLSAAVCPILLLLPLYGLYYFLMSCAKVLFTDTLQQNIENQGRATVQSLASMLQLPGGILIYMIFGMTGGFRYLQGSMIVVALWILILCLLFWILQTKKYD